MFQTSEPLIHILYDETSTLVLQLMRRCLTPEGRKELYEVDLDKKENWLREVNIGEAAKTELKKLRDGKQVSDASYSSFFRRAKQLYRRITQDISTEEFPSALPTSVTPYRKICPAVNGKIRHVAIRIKAFQRIDIVILSRTLMMMMTKNTLPRVTKW